MKYSDQEMPDFLKDFIERHKPAGLTTEEWAAQGREDIRKDEADMRMRRATASIERRLKERRALRPISTPKPVFADTQSNKDDQMDFNAIEDAMEFDR